MTSWCQSSQTLASPRVFQGALSWELRASPKPEVEARFIRVPSFLLTSFQCLVCGCYHRRCSEGRDPALATGREDFQCAVGVFSSFVPLHPVSWHCRAGGEFLQSGASADAQPPGEGPAGEGEPPLVPKGSVLARTAQTTGRSLGLDIFLAELLPLLPHCKL